MSNKKTSTNVLTPTQRLYEAIFGELPPRDMEDADLPELLDVLETITEREAKILKMRFGLACEAMTRSKIAAEFHVGDERIRQIEAKALRKLGHESRARRIRPLFFTGSEQRAMLKERDKQIAELEYVITLLREENFNLRKRVAELEHPNNRDAQWRYITNGDATASLACRLSQKIEALSLSVRSYNCLSRGGLYTVKDVALSYNEGNLIKLRNLGKRSFAEVESKLRELGIPLNQPDEFYYV